MYYGSIEAGGTKFVCGIGNDALDIVERVSFPTTTPSETMSLVFDYFDQYKDQLKAIGVGSFGPIDIKKESPTYGYITNTPKIPWQQYDFVGSLKERYQIPIAWTTDVNSSAYGELKKGAGKGLSSLVYYTIGTGVGGGAFSNGDFVGGFTHSEMGHVYVERHPNDHYDGNCPFHGNCLEGMTAGPSIEDRYGIKGQDLAEDHEVWDFIAYYIAQAVYNTTLYFAPERIIIGGGVMKQAHLLEKVYGYFDTLMKNYVTVPSLDHYVVTPGLGDDAGTVGCLGLARDL